MNKKQLLITALATLIIVSLPFFNLLGENTESRNQSAQLQLNKFWETEEIMSDYVKNAEIVYENYLATDFDDEFQVNIIRQSTNYGDASEDNYLVVVNQSLYNPATMSSFTTYIDDLESEGWSVRLVTCTNTGDPVLFRDYLIQEYNDNYIRGTFLIGGLPVAYYEMPMTNADGDTTGWNFFPCDLYYMDTDGEWIDNCGYKGRYDDHTGAVYPDMWVGRLYTPTMTYHEVTEAQHVTRYLQKCHNYREGTLRLKDQALCYVQPDWAGPPEQSEVFIVYDEVGFYNDGIEGVTVSAADYRYRVRASTNNRYEWCYIAAHSSATYHGFSDGGFFSEEVDDIDVQVLFFLNFNCTSALITANNCICSWYVMQDPYGLISLGSSKPGSMVCQADYYTGLSTGNTIGDAYLFWGLAYFEMRDWHYGLILSGDPTLKIGRFMEKPGPNFSYALSPDRDDVVSTATPTFEWTATDGADHYKLIIEGNSAIWSSGDLQATSFQVPSDLLKNKVDYTWTVKAYAGLECIDFSQPRSFSYVNQATAIDPFDDDETLPRDLAILGNFPNPFNSSTMISFYVPDRQPISVKVYNALGQNVKTLLNREFLSGSQTVAWDGTNEAGRLATSGLYFCRISDGNELKMSKMLFIR